MNTDSKDGKTLEEIVAQIQSQMNAQSSQLNSQNALIATILERMPLVAPAPHTPMTTSTGPQQTPPPRSTPLPTIPESAQSPLSIATRRSLFVEGPSVPAPGPAASVASNAADSESLSGTTSSLLGAMDAPSPILVKILVDGKPTFTGKTMADKADARGFLRSVKRWMLASLKHESDAARVEVFRSMLLGPAGKWFEGVQTSHEEHGSTLTLQQAFDAFIKTYEGTVSLKMAEAQLNNLVYGRGECKDLISLESEFDRLTRMCYPGAETSKVANRLIANIYSDIIFRGDKGLWEKAMEADPDTLEEWKAATQNAWAILQKRNVSPGGSGGRSMHGSAPLYTATGLTPRATATVKLQQAQHTETKSNSVGETLDDSEGVTEEELAEVDPKKVVRYGAHLTQEQRVSLMRLGKCWICLQKGHIAKVCPQAGKNGYPRKPKVEDLKA